MGECNQTMENQFRSFAWDFIPPNSTMLTKKQKIDLGKRLVRGVKKYRKDVQARMKMIKEKEKSLRKILKELEEDV